MMEPASEAFTTSCSPARSAARAMISSAALPKVAFRSPPMPSPMRAASCSVACPIQPARGRIASPEATKIHSGRSGTACLSAIATGTTLARARAAGLDAAAALERNDAYPLFDRIDDLLRTGPTGTNVMDLMLVLIGE